MAVGTAYKSVDMVFSDVWDGDVTRAASDQITITNWPREQNYFGSFQYDDYGLAGGYVSRSTYHEYGGCSKFCVSQFPVIS